VSGRERIEKRFAALAAEGRGGLVTFITAGDPDHQTSSAILAGLPAAGADIIELGMPFSDPAADGPAIEAASVRALAAGASMKRTLEMVAGFRKSDDATPIVLMGYFNPLYAYGIESFLDDAVAAGVDGLIIVDLPPEEEAELTLPAAKREIHLIRLVAPTSGPERLKLLFRECGGFVYYIAIAGITGAGGAAIGDTEDALARLRRETGLPIAVGFGIKTPGDAAQVARTADAAVVGSAIVAVVAENLDDHGRPQPGLVDKVLDFVGQLADSVRAARG
jgi:tryptophan synthase alpha chain